MHSSKATDKRTKRVATNHKSDKGHAYRVYKELSKPNEKEKKGQIFEKTLHQRRNKLVKKVIDYSLEKYKLKHSEIPPHIRI